MNKIKILNYLAIVSDHSHVSGKFMRVCTEVGDPVEPVGALSAGNGFAASPVAPAPAAPAGPAMPGAIG